MKTSLRRRALLSFLGVVVFGISASATQAQVLSEILRRMDRHNASVSSVKADVLMVKYNAQLDDTDKPQIGATQYLPKQKGTGDKLYVRIDWKEPRVESLAIVGDEYKLYQPKFNQMIKGNVQKSKNSAAAGGALGFMTMSRQQLKDNYDVVFIAQENLKDGTRTAHLQLTPKTRQSYKLAELWVDSDGMPRQARITENNSDTTTVLLTNITKNSIIKAALFEIKPPKGTKVLEQ
jgi:outer membrane lipoprotein-sorting protein